METLKTIQELEKIKNQMVSWIVEIDSTITKLRNISIQFSKTSNDKKVKNRLPSNNLMINISSIKLDDYKKEEHLKGKVIYILNCLNRFLHASEIASIIQYYEQDIDIREIMAKLSPVFSSLKKEGILVKVSPENKNSKVFWGFDHWLDKDKVVKKHHLFDYTLLLKSKKL